MLGLIMTLYYIVYTKNLHEFPGVDSVNCTGTMQYPIHRSMHIAIYRIWIHIKIEPYDRMQKIKKMLISEMHKLNAVLNF